MRECCVMVPAVYMELQRKYPKDSPCEHCTYHKYGCPNVTAFTVGIHKYIPIEQSPDELPKSGIWCKTCKDTSGKIFHKTLWNGRTAFAVRCRRCGQEFLLYEDHVRQKYTGFVNGHGDFVPADPYGTRSIPVSSSNRGIYSLLGDTQEAVVYSTENEDTKPMTAMELAMKKAGLL